MCIFLTPMERYIEGRAYFLCSYTIRLRKMYLRRKGKGQQGKERKGFVFLLFQDNFPPILHILIFRRPMLSLMAIQSYKKKNKKRTCEGQQ